jgi:hypothetical protein
LGKDLNDEDEDKDKGFLWFKENIKDVCIAEVKKPQMSHDIVFS